MEYNSKELEQYLKSKIVYDNNECWIWKGCVDRRNGLPLVRPRSGSNIKISAAKLSYQVFTGVQPYFRLSRCVHTRQCINPSHLRPQTIEAASQNYTVNEKGCHIYQGKNFADRYATVEVKGRPVKLSRYLLSQKIGRSLHKKEFACHKCDNPSCINLEHLFIGSNRDNILDCVAKNRANRAKGASHICAILTEKDVLEIRDSKENSTILGKRYNVKPVTIRDVKLRNSWKHI